MATLLERSKVRAAELRNRDQMATSALLEITELKRQIQQKTTKLNKLTIQADLLLDEAEQLELKDLEIRINAMRRRQLETKYLPSLSCFGITRLPKEWKLKYLTSLSHKEKKELEGSKDISQFVSNYKRIYSEHYAASDKKEQLSPSVLNEKIYTILSNSQSGDSISFNGRVIVVFYNKESSMVEVIPTVTDDEGEHFMSACLLPMVKLLLPVYQKEEIDIWPSVVGYTDEDGDLVHFREEDEEENEDDED